MIMNKILFLSSTFVVGLVAHAQTPVTGAAPAPVAPGQPVVMPAMPSGVVVDNPGALATPGSAPAAVPIDPAQQQMQMQMLMQMMQNQNKGKGNKQPPIPQGLGNMLNGLGSGGAGGSGARGSGDAAGGGPGGSGEGSSGGGAGVDNCPGAWPDPAALQNMLKCTKGLSQATNRLAGLVDIDKKVMFIIDRSGGGKVVKCVPISTGKNGAGGSYGQTPTGCMITTSHHGDYQSSATGTQKDCIGLAGTDSLTKSREAAGVIMHKAHGGAGGSTTLGCIGVKDGEFDQIKEMLYGSDSSQKRSVVCAFNAQTKTECKIGQGGSVSASAETNSSGSTSGSAPARK